MAQISTLGALPEPNFLPTAGNSAQKNTAAKSYNSVATDEAQSSPLQTQLTHLSSLLNSLQKNANGARAQYVQALSQVKSGTYTVNSLDVSRSIVSDLLSSR